MELRGKTAVITGGGRGIGRAAAIDLAKEGCNIIISARNEKELKDVVKEAEVFGVKALGLALDLAVEDNVDKLIDQAVEKFGTLDILINNAGVIFPKPFMETTLEELDITMDINLRTAYLLGRKALSIMKEKRSGYIINISSTVALAVPAHLATYGMSKCAMVGLSQALYEAAKEFGVKVSTIYPGITDTKMVRDINHIQDPKEWMLPEDISYCIMFLLKASDRMVVKDVVPWSTGYDKI